MKLITHKGTSSEEAYWVFVTALDQFNKDMISSIDIRYIQRYTNFDGNPVTEINSCIVMKPIIRSIKVTFGVTE